MEKLIVVFLSMILFPHGTYAVTYPNCWNGVQGSTYKGSQSTTASGSSCQRWDSDFPHDHEYIDDDAAFASDGTVTDAANYCRDPAHDFNEPWCYSLDPGTGAEACGIPQCSDLPCQDEDETGVADAVTLEEMDDFLDDREGINVLLKDPNYRLHCCGTVKKWLFYMESAGEIHLQIWKLDENGLYVLKGENVFIKNEADEYEVQEEEITELYKRISVDQGDFIGWFSPGKGQITHKNDGDELGNLLLETTAPSVGQAVNFGGATVENTREYAIGLQVAQNLAPYFANIDDTVTITVDKEIGDPVFTVSVSDDDPKDVDTLAVSMSTSEYFEVNATSHVVQVKSALAIGEYELKFIVMDHCKATGDAYTLTITVTAVDVKITNPSSFGSVSETATTETLAYTLMFASAVPHTCTIDTYSPTRPEGNPFLIKATPTSEVGVYLKSGAAVRYKVAESYDLTITCRDGSTSDTRMVTINIEPNPLPTFDNWQASVTISASATPNGKIVLTGTVTATEPVTIALDSCDPTPCPFGVNNDVEIFTTQDFFLHDVPLYTLTLSADDSYNIVTSPQLTVTVTGLNAKPIFINLPKTEPVPVLEGTPIGTEVFKVLQHDGDGDNVIFSTLYTPSECSSLFNLAPTDGRITTLAEFDYDTAAVTSCVLTVIVNDGKTNSDPESITIEITNIDEPPEFSSTSYKISTPEVASGTVLPDPGITVTDPENTAVSLALNCGADSSYLSLDSTTRLVTMVTEFELDPSLPSYKMTCTIKGSDGTGQTSLVSLEIEVTDANDNKPTFNGTGTFTFYLLTTQPTGIIGSVPATDADSTSPNNLVKYSMTGSTKFDIDTDGNILLVGDITGDISVAPYALIVTAADDGVPSMSNSATVRVFVSAPTTTTTTTTTTTPSTTQSESLTSSTAASATESTEGFFTKDLNIIIFALAIVFGTLVLIGAAYLIYRLCCKGQSASDQKKISFENDGLGASLDKEALPKWARITNFKSRNNEIHKVKPANEQNGDYDISHRRDQDDNRPVSGDSGINMTPRRRPSNVSLTGISIHPADDVRSSNVSKPAYPRTDDLFNIRQWKVEQTGWRKALHAGRPIP